MVKIIAIFCVMFSAAVLLAFIPAVTDHKISVVNHVIMAAGGEAPIGGNDANTLLLIHFDGTNDQNVFTDASTNLRVITTAGAVHVETASPKFGTGCGRFFIDANNRLSVPASSSWAFNTNLSFTIDFWVAFTSGLDNDYMLDIGANGSVLAWNAGNWKIACPDGTTRYTYSNTPATNEVWIHYALVRDVNIWRLFLNGTKVAGGTNNYIFGAADVAMSIGNFGGAAGVGHIGWLDEFRISNVPRYTNDFTPATGEYTEP